MTTYQFHWWPSRNLGAQVPTVRLTADSQLHGAALALRHFMQLGCDMNAPLAHVDITEPDGAKQTLLVEEVLHWLHHPKQTAFVKREGLETLLT
jgi:hypothetical protein